jgi:hypothetical protein
LIHRGLVAHQGIQTSPQQFSGSLSIRESIFWGHVIKIALGQPLETGNLGCGLCDIFDGFGKRLDYDHLLGIRTGDVSLEALKRVDNLVESRLETGTLLVCSGFLVGGSAS